MVHILDDSTQPPREDQMEAFAEEENTITEEEDRSLSDYKENLGKFIYAYQSGSLRVFNDVNAMHFL